jgi:hypothetical protein
MRIGFFGDSFVMEESNPHSWYHNYDTYIRRLKKHYNADIVNLGIGGSSYWDLMLKQFPPFLDNLPDVTVFCWTDSSRIYDPEVRNINMWTASTNLIKDFQLNKLLKYKKYKAAKDFFEHLHDHDKADREMVSALYYFDREVLAPIQDKTKIIHLWSFGKGIDWERKNVYTPDNVKYLYRWQTGVELRPSLKCFSPIGTLTDNDNLSANHLGSEENNSLVFNLIKNAIDDHSNNLCVTEQINYNAR